MGLLELKLKCIRCGYGIPLTSQEHREAKDIKCPRCSHVFSLLRDEEENPLEYPGK